MNTSIDSHWDVKRTVFRAAKIVAGLNRALEWNFFILVVIKKRIIFTIKQWEKVCGCSSSMLVKSTLSVKVRRDVTMQMGHMEYGSKIDAIKLINYFHLTALP